MHKGVIRQLLSYLWPGIHVAPCSHFRQITCRSTHAKVRLTKEYDWQNSSESRLTRGRFTSKDKYLPYIALSIEYPFSIGASASMGRLMWSQCHFILQPTSRRKQWDTVVVYFPRKGVKQRENSMYLFFRGFLKKYFHFCTQGTFLTPPRISSLATFSISLANMVKLFNIATALAAWSVIEPGLAHPGEAHNIANVKRELAIRDHLTSHSKRALGNCENSPKARALKEQAIARRAATANSLRHERGFSSSSTSKSCSTPDVLTNWHCRTVQARCCRTRCVRSELAPTK